MYDKCIKKDSLKNVLQIHIILKYCTEIKIWRDL